MNKDEILKEIEKKQNNIKHEKQAELLKRQTLPNTQQTNKT